MGVRQGQGRDHLILLERDAAFDAYQKARRRLPPVIREGACERVDTLADIADQFDVFLLDAFGVLNLGDTAIAGVPERMADLQAMGKRLLVLSNAASVPKADLLKKYARLGYAFDPDDVVTSRMTALAVLQNEPRQLWGLMAPDAMPEDDIIGQDTVFLRDDPQVYSTVDAFLFLGSGGWSEGRQELLASAMERRPRPLWVGNPDLVAPRENGFSIEPGFYAHQLADRTGVEPRFFGKPFGNIYDLAFARFGPDVDRSRVLMVGDTLHTDILGAQTAGVQSALVAGVGFFAEYPIDRAMVDSGIRPDFLLRQP